MGKKTDISSAAALLGRISSPKKAASSRRNGRKGGRPSSGACSLRELKRRVRYYCNKVCPGASRAFVSSLQRSAITYRFIWMEPPCPDFSIHDLQHYAEYPLDAMSKHRMAVCLLVPLEPRLL